MESNQDIIDLHGVRNAEKKFKSILKISKSAKTLEYVERILDAKSLLVRAIIFDKTPDKNWLVSWHQDKTVAVSDKLELAGWGP